ncbi:MAG: hypothetical protein V3U37_04175 [Nitrospinaceae bacterium]
MSTILKTLKKLEEEKSVLDQNVDLKSLVLQGENFPAPFQKAVTGKVGWAAGLISGGILLGWLLFAFLSRSEAPKPSAASTFMKPAPVQAFSNEPIASSPEPHSGIPLSNISGVGQSEITPAPKRSFFAEDAIEPDPVAEPEPPWEKFADLPPEFEEIGALIETVKNLPAPAPPDSNIRRGYIPGMKVKGIIFFGEDSPSNHIFVSTPSKSNLKMKSGDVAFNAILQSIQPNKAVFSYRNKLIAIEIGD